MPIIHIYVKTYNIILSPPLIDYFYAMMINHFSILSFLSFYLENFILPYTQNGTFYIYKIILYFIRKYIWLWIIIKILIRAMIFYVFILYKGENYTQFSRRLIFYLCFMLRILIYQLYAHCEKTFVERFCIPPMGKMILTIDISTSIFY